jgi:hypothetical protein
MAGNGIAWLAMIDSASNEKHGIAQLHNAGENSCSGAMKLLYILYAITRRQLVSLLHGAGLINCAKWRQGNERIYHPKIPNDL